MRTPNFTDIPKLAIIVGFILLGIGLNMMFGETIQNLKTDIKKIENSIVNYTVGEPIAFDITPTYDIFSNPPVESIILILEKDIIFAGDTIKITGVANNVKDNIVMISLILNDGTISLTNKTNPEILFERDYAGRHNLLLDLRADTNPKFTDEVSPKFNIPKTFHVAGAIFLEDGSIHTIKNSDEIFTIDSKINKLQVDTNQSILEQIEQTKINNLQQEITNQMFLGLTIIGIAVVAIAGGCDFWYRIKQN